MNFLTYEAAESHEREERETPFEVLRYGIDEDLNDEYIIVSRHRCDTDAIKACEERIAKLSRVDKNCGVYYFVRQRLDDGTYKTI